MTDGAAANNDSGEPNDWLGNATRNGEKANDFVGLDVQRVEDMRCEMPALTTASSATAHFHTRAPAV